MIVVDASVAVKWLIPEAGEQAAKALLADARQLVGVRSTNHTFAPVI